MRQNRRRRNKLKRFNFSSFFTCAKSRSNRTPIERNYQEKYVNKITNTSPSSSKSKTFFFRVIKIHIYNKMFCLLDYMSSHAVLIWEGTHLCTFLRIQIIKYNKLRYVFHVVRTYSNHCYLAYDKKRKDCHYNVQNRARNKKYTKDRWVQVGPTQQ